MKYKKQRGELKIEVLLEYANSIIATLREPFLVLDKNLRVISASQSFYASFAESKFAGAIMIAGPSFRFTDKSVRYWGKLLLRVTARLSLEFKAKGVM